MTKYTRLSLRISDVGSKVITNIVRAEEGEPGDEASLSFFCFLVIASDCVWPPISHSISYPPEYRVRILLTLSTIFTDTPYFEHNLYRARHGACAYYSDDGIYNAP